MKISTLAPETFVPKWNGNRDLPEAEQIQVTVSFPTIEEFESYGGDVGRKTDAVGLVKACTPKITNLEVADTEITDGEILCSQRKHAVAGLVSEIFLYLIRGTQLGEEQEKN